ncbi:MAG: MFS transporter [Chloroflexi bacterium]|nr:MFS transporter [Chloroflexota bacterium]
MTNRWGVLAILCLTRVAMGLHLQAVAAVAPFMMADLSLGYAEIGTLIGVFMLPGVVFAVPGGLIGRRFGDTHTMTGALVLLMAGTALLAVSDGFWPALVARLLSGAGGTLMTMQIAKIATDWFADRELSTAIGILLGTFPLGIAAVMAGLPAIASLTSWRVAVGVVAASAAIMLAVVILFLRDHPETVTARGSRPPLWVISLPEIGLVVMSGAAFSLLNAGLVVFSSFVPALLLSRGMDAVQAGLTTSWASWVGMLTLPAAGLLLDRLRPMTPWLLGSAAASSAVCLLMVIGGPPWLWIVLFPLAMAPVAVGSMALPGEVLRSESRSTGFGLYFTTNYIGFGLLPAVAGYLVDWSGSVAAPLWFDAAVFGGIVPLIVLFRVLQRRQQHAERS